MSFDKYFEFAKKRIPGYAGFTMSQQLVSITALTPDALPELERMIRKNPDVVNETGHYVYTSLIITCKYLGTLTSLECLKLLLDNGANYNILFHDQSNVLHIVARNAKYSCLVEAFTLVKTGCDINNRTVCGSILCDLIIRNTEDSLKLAELLIDLGADLEIVNSMKQTCLMLICR